MALGVDVENRRAMRDDGALTGIANRVLTDRELHFWERSDDRERAPLLLRYWVCKEALLKATGYGLAIEPDTIELSYTGQRDPVVDSFRSALIPPDAEWHLLLEWADSDHLCAVAADCRVDSCHRFELLLDSPGPRFLSRPSQAV